MRGIVASIVVASACVIATWSPAVGQIAERGRTRAPFTRDGDFRGVSASMASVATSVGDERWDGRFAHPHPGVDGVVQALAVDAGGNLYAGGVFSVAGGIAAKNIARWSRGAWSALGSGMDRQVSALAVDGGGSLYAGGHFNTAGGVGARRVARWDGTVWSPLGTGVGVADSENVSALAVDGGGALYACGNFDIAGGVSADNAAKWDGASWSALGARLVTNTLAWGTGGTLFAGGDVVDQWDGTSWSSVGPGTDSYVYALATDGAGNLYAGGAFTTAGGVSASHIVKWDGTSWSQLGSGMNNWVRALAVSGLPG